jgi:hypothetical protein
MPQNMLERTKGLADGIKHHLQKIQGICPCVSGRSTDQSNQLGCFSYLDSIIAAEVRKTTVLSSVDYV